MGFFAIGMARMVGDEGRVIAVDVQQEVLDVLRKRARRAGVAERIRTQRCEPDGLGIHEQVDFALAFWVVHEAPDAEQFLGQIRAHMKPGANLLLAEPRSRVSEPEFTEIVAAARASGLAQRDGPRVQLCRAALFEAC
jgi:2-polyprenyl-3-methyl-5-hydroxy-6-metoxy-1,4-benzoquinol methylase